MAGIFGDRITEAEAEQAEAMANGHPCPTCGRSNDWLPRGRYGDFIVLDCDTCDNGMVRVKLPAQPNTPTTNEGSNTCPPESAEPRLS
jgi:hypothetical protein